MVRDEKGLTLVEVMAGVVLLGLIALTFSQLSHFTSSVFYQTDKQSKALRIAERELHQKTAAIAAAPSVPSVDSQDEPPKTVDGFSVRTDETEVGASPAYSPPTYDNAVSVQSIVILQEGGTRTPRLLTVTVSWEE